MKLPVDDILPAIRQSLSEHPYLVIEAPPGAGKTTRVPPAIAPLIDGEVVVLEPRRIAARLAARRVAEELGERPGETVGYQVRFEEVASPRTRIRFVTEGVLTRRLLSDPILRGVGAVILDEFHERHLDGDLALALLRRFRRDLKLIVMSATLQAEPIARYLGGCPQLRSEGRLFPLEISYTPHSPLTLEEQVAAAAESILRANHSGDILVFLPGAAEIRRAARTCERLARVYDLLAVPLYGDLSPAEQDRAVMPASQRKLILSTNVAESSITIDGVTAVIDSGLARIASDSPWTGLPTLQVSRVSKASATQRAGRAGRTAPGRVVRLYTAEDFHRRPDQDTPEITRRELSQLCLDLRVMGLANPQDVEWLDAPPEPAIASAEALLDRLNANGSQAKRMAQLPLHPRLAKLVLESVERGAGEEGCLVAALVSAGARSPTTDLISLIDTSLEPYVRQQYEQIRRLVRPPRSRPSSMDPLLKSILTAFPDRVARKRRGNQAQLANGTFVALPESSHVSEFFVAVDVEDRSENAMPIIRLTSPIEASWLLDLFPDRVQARESVEWNRVAERVECASALVFDELVIEESRSGSPEPEQASRLLAQRAIDAGIERFLEPDELKELLARVAFAGLPQPDLEAALREVCYGLRSFAELKGAVILPAIERQIDRARLEAIAPSRVQLPSGRTTRIRYEEGKPPWIASRLQDFFGMKETPKIGAAKVPLVVHLLAPNQRPVQTTTDLAGFWQRLYPQVRRELSRRYPRHSWPEDPG